MLFRTVVSALTVLTCASACGGSTAGPASGSGATSAPASPSSPVANDLDASALLFDVHDAYAVLDGQVPQVGAARNERSIPVDKVNVQKCTATRHDAAFADFASRRYATAAAVDANRGWWGPAVDTPTGTGGDPSKYIDQVVVKLPTAADAMTLLEAGRLSAACGEVRVVDSAGRPTDSAFSATGKTIVLERSAGDATFISQESDGSVTVVVAVGRIWVRISASASHASPDKIVELLARRIASAT